MWGRVLPRQLRRGRTSLAALHPALTGDPANRLAGAAVDECLGIILGQAKHPFFKAMLSELRAFGVGILQRPTELRPTATIEFVANGLRDELAEVLLLPVNVS